jgi:hypothetical protein
VDIPLGDGFHSYRLHLESDVEVGEAVAELARQRGWRLRELRRDERSLEQVFRELTATAALPAPAPPTSPASTAQWAPPGAGAGAPTHETLGSDVAS